MADIEANGDANSRHLDLHQLQDLLQREYNVSENDSELRGRLLDVLDSMLEKELYGTDEILKSHERE